MKRYLVFVGETHYPDGGWNDYRSCHDDIEDAASACRATAETMVRLDPWGHVVDTETMKVVRRFVVRIRYRNGRPAEDEVVEL